MVGTDFRVQSDRLVRVTIEPVREEYWFGVLDLFVDHFVPILGGAEVKVQLFMFRQRDRISGVVSDIPQSKIAQVLDLSPAAVSSSVRTLTSLFDLETRRPILLHQQSPTSWLVAPACRFRGARVQPAEERVQPNERPFSRLNTEPAPSRDTRARTNQTKSSDRESEPKAGEHARGSVVGWPSLDLFGERALQRGDVAGVLTALRVWAYAAEALASSKAITCDRVLRVAAEVSVDKSAGNKPFCLAKRLARELGVELPPVPGSRRMVTPELQGLASVIASRRANGGLR